jgi:hypothetical protein
VEWSSEAPQLELRNKLDEKKKKQKMEVNILQKCDQLKNVLKRIDRMWDYSLQKLKAAINSHTIY